MFHLNSRSIWERNVRPIFHERTHQELSLLAEHIPHAIGLYGEVGIGLVTTVTYLAELVGVTPEFVYPERNDVVDREKGAITIAIIRRLYEQTRSKVTTRRIIVITAADTMSLEAQNAFLKLLEEPTPNTTFVLLFHDSRKLLPTVISRLQLYQVHPITRLQSEQLLDRLEVNDPKRRQQLLFLAEGRPAQLVTLAHDDALFEAEATILRQARKFVQGGFYERLVICHELGSSRSNAEKFVMYAMNILQFDIVTKQTADETIVRFLERLNQALGALQANGNVRLVLARTAL